MDETPRGVVRSPLAEGVLHLGPEVGASGLFVCVIGLLALEPSPQDDDLDLLDVFRRIDPEAGEVPRGRRDDAIALEFDEPVPRTSEDRSRHGTSSRPVDHDTHRLLLGNHEIPAFMVRSVYVGYWQIATVQGAAMAKIAAKQARRGKLAHARGGGRWAALADLASTLNAIRSLERHLGANEPALRPYIAVRERFVAPLWAHRPTILFGHDYTNVTAAAVKSLADCLAVRDFKRVWPSIRALAVEDGWERLRVCGRSGCGRWYADRTKNRSQRWCGKGCPENPWNSRSYRLRRKRARIAAGKRQHGGPPAKSTPGVPRSTNR